jgi:hypothetical protein
LSIFLLHVRLATSKEFGLLWYGLDRSHCINFGAPMVARGEGGALLFVVIINVNSHLVNSFVLPKWVPQECSMMPVIIDNAMVGSQPLTAPEQDGF